MKPRWTVPRPLPPQVGQGRLREPAARPVAPQASQAARRLTRILVWTPWMASSKPICIEYWRSSPRSGPPGAASAPRVAAPAEEILEEIPEGRRPVVGEIEALEARPPGPPGPAPAPGGTPPRSPNWSYWARFFGSLRTE